ncbi:MAG: L,D-transpeptidase [Hyphomicrobium sp.]
MGKSQIILRTLSGGAKRGWLEFGPLRWPCALGRGGLSSRKREGDGSTPRGRFRLLYGLRRFDKFALLGTSVRLMRITPDLGWCDAPSDHNYNRIVCHPYRASAERLWRDDDLYDCVIVLDYNVKPRVRDRGSAIFLHIAREDFSPTEGCVALRKRDLRSLLARVRSTTQLVIS